MVTVSHIDNIVMKMFSQCCYTAYITILSILENLCQKPWHSATQKNPWHMKILSWQKLDTPQKSCVWKLSNCCHDNIFKLYMFWVNFWLNFDPKYSFFVKNSHTLSAIWHRFSRFSNNLKIFPCVKSVTIQWHINLHYL